MKEFLNFIDLEYDEVNIKEVDGAKQKLEALAGDAEVPVLAVGEETVKGFDRETIVELLERNDIEVDRAPSPR